MWLAFSPPTFIIHCYVLRWPLLIQDLHLMIKHKKWRGNFVTCALSLVWWYKPQWVCIYGEKMLWGLCARFAGVLVLCFCFLAPCTRCPWLSVTTREVMALPYAARHLWYWEEEFLTLPTRNSFNRSCHIDRCRRRLWRGRGYNNCRIPKLCGVVLLLAVCSSTRHFDSP